MKSKFAFIGMVVFGTILFLMPSVYAGGLPNEPEDAAIEEAREDFMADLEEISVNRKAVIEEIVAMWFMDEPGWEEQFRSTLDFAHDNQLLAILHADSYPQVKAILGDGVETLGDTDKDFVFSPVDPCWCVDTRIGGGGFISAGSIRDYNVYGNLASQGGSNCPAPRGEPRAVLLTVIAVNPSGKGNLNVVPYGVNPRTQGALSVNFNVTAGTNLANTGIIKTAYLGAADISLSSNYSGCHAVISVLGYYYEADLGLDKLYYQAKKSYLLAAGQTGEFTATCASGYFVMGGGWDSRRNEAPHYRDRNVNDYSNWPDGNNGWKVGIYNNSGQFHWLTVYAICMKLQ